ncbi:UrcA family protein [Sphingomonas sp. BN140010]|uniref:UrcA family protein n=1 Tax=Sphingomonas arvum TaxID=2992113 RepID=A0ABT3JGS8_9SPHN|nr:UrcA family protein [Sphingomonas sp. BN140010]MCW3798294.1 UrcA family protein [Sphingomonas sp. BN140010]
MNATKLLMGAAALCVSSVAVMAAAGPAQARDVTVRAAVSDDVPRAAVYIGDLQLASAQGKKSLNRRVNFAVAKVCYPHREGALSRSYTRCVETAWDGARPQMARAIATAERYAQAGTANLAVAAISVSAGSAQ